jgi:prepilin-type processing-associated H-X9-DG protein
MATASFMYYTDYDDTLFLYRTSTSNPQWNPFWQDPNVGSGACAGSSSSQKQFWDVLLFPYIKSYDMFKGPGVSNAWVNIEPSGGTQAGPGGNPDCSYGGQNSYGVNRIVFNANQPAMNASVLVDTSNTLIITDTTYYDVMPKMSGHDATNAWAPNGIFNGDPQQTPYFANEQSDCGYYNYWVQLGGSACDAATGYGDPYGSVNADNAYITLVKKRNGGMLNAAFADGHAKVFPAERVIWDLVDNGNKLTSFWDPWKQGVK